jgi:ABC-type amino acid transport substrate-binding protein
MSEVDDRGRLKGLIADLLTLMSQRAGLQFTLVPTRSWAQSMALFQDRKLDLIPAMTPTAERQQFARFTPTTRRSTGLSWRGRGWPSSPPPGH